MLNIRPVQAADVPALERFIEEAKCIFGMPLSRSWSIENQVSESVTAFSYGEGESSANYIFLALEGVEIVGVLELNTLMGYGINCLSYSSSKALHRSDTLSICHEQSVLTLDQGLLGQHSLTLCFVSSGKEYAAKSLVSAAINFLANARNLFSGSIYISLPVHYGERFWQATGFPLTGISYKTCLHHHAELLPQTPLYGCFLKEVLSEVGLEDTVSKELLAWLLDQGFTTSNRLSVFDGGVILTLSQEKFVSIE